MTSKYSKNGRCIGTIVEKLTDGPTNECNTKRIPYFKMGERYPSTAIDEFQRMMADNRPVYGMRQVWHKIHGSVKQALVDGIDENLVWINV